MALYEPAHHLEYLAGYRRIRLVHHAGVALGVAVREPLLLLDVLEGLAQMPPVVDGLALSALLGGVLTRRTTSATTGAGPPPERRERRRPG